MAEKVFFGNVKEINNDYGTMYNIGLTKEDLNKLEFNEKGWANVSLKKWRSWKWYIEVLNSQQNYQNSNSSQSQSEDEDLPF